MAELPTTLEAAIAQAREATQDAIASGLQRIQVEILFPELKVMPVAEQFLSAFEAWGDQIRVLFPDAGAAALARRDWGPLPFEVRGISELKGEIQPTDQVIVLVEPSSVEVKEVEKVCEKAGDRPVVMLNPRLEDVATIGIGYAGRQLRERLLNTFESCYYLRPLDNAALLRKFPDAWQVWQETDSTYQLLAERPTKPVGEQLDEILMPSNPEGEATPTPAKPNLFAEMRRFLKALGQ